MRGARRVGGRAGGEGAGRAAARRGSTWGGPGAAWGGKGGAAAALGSAVGGAGRRSYQQEVADGLVPAVAQHLGAVFDLAHLDGLPFTDGLAELLVFALEQLAPAFLDALALGTLLEPGEFHGQAGALDAEPGGTLAIGDHADPCQRVDQPLRRIILPPADAVAVVGLERVVIIVITLAPGHQGDQPVVDRGVFFAVRPLAPGVGQRVDEEREVVADDQAQNAGQQQHAEDIAGHPAQRHRNAEVHGPDQFPVMPVLPHHDRVALEIPDLGEVDLAGRPRAQHPADMGVPEAGLDRMRITLDVVDVAVVDAMASSPHVNAVLQRHAAEKRQRQANRPARLEGAVRPHPVVAGGDAHAAEHQQDRERDPGNAAVAVDHAP